MRLLAFEEEFRVYHDVIASVVRVLRPHAEVECSALEKLEERTEVFDPDLIICSRENSTDQGGRAAWVELPLDPLRPTKICVGGRRSEQTNPSVEALLKIMDEAEGVIATEENPRGC